MSQLEEVAIPDLVSATLVVTGPAEIRLAGTIAAQNPADLLAPCFKQLHDASLRAGAPRLTVDVTDLTFVNSSSIRLFIDWAMWLREADEGKRYVLCFVTNPAITWQTTSFAALKSIVGDIVSVEERTS